jgi:hypothetical protein
MGNFRERFTGLTEEQLRIKHKVWEREQHLREQTERAIYEAEQKKFFEGEEEVYDSADWEDPFMGDNAGGVASDGPLSGAKVTFFHHGNLSLETITDSNGNFKAPWNFSRGTIVISGGTDIITGEKYNGEFKMDGDFFGKYKAVTPMTHVANHIWMNTDTEKPEEAMNLVLNTLPGLLGITLPEVDPDSLFNDDHIRLTLSGVTGAKEIQAINTMLDVHAEIIGNAVAKTIDDITREKTVAYETLSNQLLSNINGISTEKIGVGNDTGLLDCHKECCETLISKANAIILKSVDKESEESTRNIQSINMAVKTEWAQKAFEMTDNEISSKELWKSIDNKTQKGLLDSVNIPVS